MKGPPRLLEDGATDVERNLLVAGSVEQPSEDWMKSSRVALGLGTGLAAATVSTSVAAGAKAGIPIAVKIVAAVFSVAAVVGSVAYLSRDRNVPSDSRAALAPLAAPVSEVPAAPLIEPAAELSPPADLVRDKEPAAAPPPRPVADLAAPPPVAASPKTLASEIASLDGIKHLLVGGDPSAALTAIAKYRRDYPKAALGPEATVLEVQALTARGDSARAVELARRFVKMYPSSPHARQFEEMLSSPPHEP